jgi:hypothetical protein
MIVCTPHAKVGYRQATHKRKPRARKSAGVFCFWRSGPFAQWARGAAAKSPTTGLIANKPIDSRQLLEIGAIAWVAYITVADIPRPTMATAAKLFLALGAVTPVGAVTFIGAWIAFTAAIVRA